MNSVSSPVDRAGFYLFTFCAGIAPIPFGLTDASMAALVGLLLAVCLLASATVPMPNARAGRLLRSAAVLSGVVVLSSLAHVAPWNPATMAHPAWSAAAELIDGPGPSAVPNYQALQSAGYVLIPLVGFMCALVYVRDDGRFMRFVQIVLGVNFVVTAFCIAQYVVSPQSLLWASKRYYRDAFTGTFVNPNTAATHFGFLLLMALALSLRQLERVNLYDYLFGRRIPSPTERSHLQWLTAYALATFVFMLALLLTKSRAGILASFVGVASFVPGFVYFALKRRTSVARALGISVLSVLGVVIVFAFFGERFLLRLQVQGLIEEGRICTYLSTWNAIKDAAWWGTGLGTFQDIFPAYRTPACGLYGYWEMAHSVFLEGWLNLGTVFLACIALVYYQLIKTYGRGVRLRRRFRFVPLSCLGLLLILTLHSLVDFSLQVPGFSLAAAAALGAGAAVSLGARGK